MLNRLDKQEEPPSAELGLILSDLSFTPSMVLKPSLGELIRESRFVSGCSEMFFLLYRPSTSATSYSTDLRKAGSVLSRTGKGLFGFLSDCCALKFS